MDYNRAGQALLEIVSEPDMRSGQDAAAYGAEIRRIMVFLGVSDGEMSVSDDSFGLSGTYAVLVLQLCTALDCMMTALLLSEAVSFVHLDQRLLWVDLNRLIQKLQNLTLL